MEVADILRAQGHPFLEHSQSSFSYQQLKAFRAILRCRTAALGGHIDVCLKCGHEQGISYNSCRNRSCPKCQAQARERWLEARQQELLETGYFHVVFTVPHELNPLARNSPALFYDLLFAASPRPYWRSQPIQNASAPRSASSPSCTAGVRTSCSTRMSTVSSPPEDSPPTTSARSIPSALPAAHPRAPPRLSRQVPLRTEAPLQQRIARLQWSRCCVSGAELLPN